jgi:hypothetical protein
MANFKTEISDDNNFNSVLKKMKTRPFYALDSKMLDVFNSRARKFNELSPNKFKTDYDFESIIKATSAVKEPFLTRLRATKREKMGQNLTQMEQADLEYFNGTQGQACFLDDDILAQQLFNPPKYERRQRSTEYQFTIYPKYYSPSKIKDLTPLKSDEEDLNPIIDPISSEIFDFEDEKVHSVDVMTKDQIIAKT